MYLQIDTHQDWLTFGGHHEVADFTHFIDLSKESIEEDIKYFVHHLKHFPGQEVVKVRYVKERMTNW